jgi:hypothetical protein
VKKKTPETQEEKVRRAMALLREADPEAAEALDIQLAEKHQEQEVEKMILDEKEKQRRERHFWIEILPNGDDDTETHVYVGAAGADYWFEKNVMTPAPESVIKVLRNAVREGYVPVVDHERGVKAMKKVRKVRYPFQLHGEATRAQVEAWYKERAKKNGAEVEEVVYGPQQQPEALQELMAAEV